MSLVLSVYSTYPGEGRTTIATTMAKILGQNGKSVLVVELDHFRPTIALTTGITDNVRNALTYMSSLKKEGKMDVEPFLCQGANRKEFSSNIKFLSLPSDYQPEYFPEFVDQDNLVLGTSILNFSDRFVSYFRNLSYDVVIFIHPHKLNTLFGSPILIKSDYIFNVITTNPASLVESKENYLLLQDIEQDGISVSSRWKTILNKYVSNVPLEIVEKSAGQKIEGTVSLDYECIENDLTSRIGSEKLQSEISVILNKIGFEVGTKRKIFGRKVLA